MSRARRLAGHSLLRNSAFIMLTTAVNSGLGYAYWIVAAHADRPRQIGVAAALVSAMTFVAAVANLGTAPALVQLLPRARDDEAWSQTLSASIAGGAVAGFLVALVAGGLILPLTSPSLRVAGSDPAHLLLFAAGVGIWSVALISDYLFIAERRTENMVARNLAFGLLKLILLGAVAVSAIHGAVSIFATWVVGSLASLILGWRLLLPRLGRRLHPSLKGVRRTLRTMVRSYVGNYLTTLGNTIPFALLPVLVVARLSAADNAYFYVTWLLGGAFFTISSAIGSALFAEGAHGPERLGAQTRSAIGITAVVLAPVMVVFFVGGRLLLGLFGSAYAGRGGALLLILTASAVPDAITNLYIARLRATGRLRLSAAINMSMAVITLGGAWVLLPPLGLAGAGVAWTIAQCAGSVVCFGDLHVGRRRGAGRGDRSGATADPPTVTAHGT